MSQKQNKTLKILVVDNDSATVGTISAQLSSGNHEPVGAYSAREAKRLVNEENLDLILIDVMMPDIDGITLAEQLMENKLAKNTPVILFSALGIASEGFKESERIVNLSNVKAKLEKPFTAKQLLSVIDKVIKNNFK
ncbi:MAG: response regulator [Candidatus Undinarchaeales archaeon]